MTTDLLTDSLTSLPLYSQTQNQLNFNKSLAQKLICFHVFLLIQKSKRVECYYHTTTSTNYSFILPYYLFFQLVTGVDNIPEHYKPCRSLKSVPPGLLFGLWNPLKQTNDKLLSPCFIWMIFPTILRLNESFEQPLKATSTPMRDVGKTNLWYTWLFDLFRYLNMFKFNNLRNRATRNMFHFASSIKHLHVSVLLPSPPQLETLRNKLLLCSFPDVAMIQYESGSHTSFFHSKSAYLVHTQIPKSVSLSEFYNSTSVGLWWSLLLLELMPLCVCGWYLSGKNPERSFPIGRRTHRGGHCWGFYKRRPVPVQPSLSARQDVDPAASCFSGALQFPSAGSQYDPPTGREITCGGHD